MKQTEVLFVIELLLILHRNMSRSTTVVPGDHPKYNQKCSFWKINCFSCLENNYSLIIVKSKSESYLIYVLMGRL
jgi:hypothetical protein